MAAHSFVVSGLSRPARLDRVLRDRFPQAGRQQVQALINRGAVRVGGRKVWLCSWRVENGDRVDILSPLEDKPRPVQAFDPGWVIAEEQDLIAVDKPAGLLSEAPPLREAESLLDLARKRYGSLHLFHRLDRDTSGVVLLTRPGPINRYLDQAFKAGLVEREYVAIVAAPNQLQEEGAITVPLARHPRRRDKMIAVDRGGQRACTRYRVVRSVAGAQQVILWPQTGRTHQLRVHLAHLGAPIQGDRLYNPRWRETPRLLLHARRITLPEADDYPRRTYQARIPGEFDLA